jgi:hypothetical protein
VVAATAAALVLGAGVGVAAWSSSGTGSAGAKATTLQAVTVTAGTTSAQLYPGGTGDVVLSVTNPNPFPVKITQVSQDTSAGKYVSSDQGSNCTDANATHPTGVTLTTATGAPLATVAASSTGTVTLTGKAAMSNASDNLCQGATFSIPVVVTATS